MAVSISAITTSGFTVNWTSHGEGIVNYNIEVFEGSQLIKSAYGIASTVRSYGVIGLNSNTTYEVKLYSRTSTGTVVLIEYAYPTTVAARPSNWEWSIPKVKGASYSIVNGRFTNLVTYSEIMGFRSRINEFRTYKGAGTYTFGSMPQGSVFTMSMYNQLEAAISGMGPSLPTYGQNPTGSFYTVDILLNRLRDSLNSIV